MTSPNRAIFGAEAPSEDLLVPLRDLNDADRVGSTVEYFSRKMSRPVEFLTVIDTETDLEATVRELGQIATRFQNQGMNGQAEPGEQREASARVVVSNNPAADFLVCCCHRLVCMPTSATPFANGRFVGSYASALLARSDQPAILVGPMVDGGEPVDFDDMILALSGDEQCLSLLPAARSLAEALGLPVRNVHVIEERDDQVVANAQGELRLWFPDALFSTVAIEPVAAEDVGSGLAQYSNRSLLAVATHARTGLARLAEGSRTFDAVGASTRPVVVVGPHIDALSVGTTGPRSVNEDGAFMPADFSESQIVREVTFDPRHGAAAVRK